MSSENRFTYDDALLFMSEASAPISKFCKHDVKFRADSTVNKGKTSTDFLHPVGALGYSPMVLTVGVKRLKENMNADGYVRNEDVIWALSQVFHESAHV